MLQAGFISGSIGETFWITFKSDLFRFEAYPLGASVSGGAP